MLSIGDTVLFHFIASHTCDGQVCKCAHQNRKAKVLRTYPDSDAADLIVAFTDAELNPGGVLSASSIQMAVPAGKIGELPRAGVAWTAMPAASLVDLSKGVSSVTPRKR